MRLIAEHTERELIGRFLDYLKSKGVGAEIRPLNAGWSLWVYDEDACHAARREYAAFLSDPAAIRYGVSVPAVAEAADERPLPPPPAVRDRRRIAIRLPRRLHHGMPVTLVLMAVSVAVTLPVLLALPIGHGLVAGLRANEHWTAQWWRLISPAFLHFTWLHIIFNMLWLRELGSLVERVKGPRFLLLFFLVTAGISNYAQLVAEAGQLFGGMSGVVYGLFGYIWVKARFFPDDGFTIDSATVMMLMLWFLLGWTGLVGPIANWAHGFGLGVGGALALAPGWRRSPSPGD